MTNLAYNRFRNQGALSQAGVDLSRKCNDDSGIGWRVFMRPDLANLLVLRCIPPLKSLC